MNWTYQFMNNERRKVFLKILDPSNLIFRLDALLFRKIQIGMNCAFSDEIFDSILQKNKFQFLEVILFLFNIYIRRKI